MCRVLYLGIIYYGQVSRCGGGMVSLLPCHCRNDGFTEVKRKGRRRYFTKKLPPAPPSVFSSREEQHEQVPHIPLLVEKVVACRLERTHRETGHHIIYFPLYTDSTSKRPSFIPWSVSSYNSPHNYMHVHIYSFPIVCVSGVSASQHHRVLWNWTCWDMLHRSPAVCLPPGAGRDVPATSNITCHVLGLRSCPVRSWKGYHQQMWMPNHH